MPFRNPVVGGTVLVRQAINSPNYVPGASGWSINQDGSAEFAGPVTLHVILITAGPVIQPVLEVRYSGDTANRWQVGNTGIMAWGDGTNTPDVFLQRTGPGALRLDGILAVDQSLSTADVFEAFVTGDTNRRLKVFADGSLHWGDGTNPTDVSITRSAAGVLHVSGEISAAEVAAQNTGPGTITLAVGDSGQAFFALVVDPQGVIHLGPGTGARDTVLYRAATATLAADPIKYNSSGSAEAWTGLTLVNGFTNRSIGTPGVPNLSYRRVASPYGEVELCGQIVSGATIASGTTIATLPASPPGGSTGYRPSTQQIIRANNLSVMGNNVLVTVETDGTVHLYGTWANGHAITIGPDTYPVDL